MQTRSRQHHQDGFPNLRNETPPKRAIKLRSSLSETARPLLNMQVKIIARLAALAFLLCAACQSTVSEKLPTKTGGQRPGVLAAGDVIKISFSGAPELNQSQKIGTDGKVGLPMVGDVYAAGKSVKNFQDELAGLYKSQLQNSEVIVTLESVAIPIVVSGEVQKPGKIVFERPATILEAIMEAGGFTPYADLKKVSLIRIVNGAHHTQIFDLSPVLRGQPTPITYVRGGDVIYVRQKLFAF